MGHTYSGIMFIILFFNTSVKCDQVHVYCHTVINPRHMHRRVMVVVLSVCLYVTTLAATYLVCKSNLRCCKFLVTFQTHDLCGFRQKRFVRQSWHHFADSKLLDLSRLALA